MLSNKRNMVSKKEIVGLINQNKLKEIKQLFKATGDDALKWSDDIMELSPIHIASALGREEIVQFLISDQIDKNPGLIRANSFTPLHAASMHGRINIVKLLIEKKVDVNVQTIPQGYAPIHSASFGGHLAVVELLINSGAKIDLENYRKEKPIDTARRQGKLEVVTFLEHIFS